MAVQEAYDAVMRVRTEDHPALFAPGGRLHSWLERSLKIGGLSLLGFCFLAYLDLWVYQGFNSFTLEKHAAEGALRLEARTRYAQGQSMGWIEIPRLGISAVVAHGDDTRTLMRAVGHIPGTAFPGEGGNVGLAAHRDTFFRALEGVESSDRIRLVMPQETLAYRVIEVSVVRPSRVDVLDATPEPSLTLVTCYPFDFIGTAPYRFVVRARQIADADGTE
jgi:sortase A